MKLLTFATTCLSALHLVSSQLVTPSYVEYEVDVIERDFAIPSFVSELLSGFDVADYISNLDYEKIAGWADDLLNSGDNIDILDNILIKLKDSKIITKAAVYLITHNETWGVLEETLPAVLKVAGNINTTSLLTALDRSGLAYSVVAGALTSDQFLPSVLEIAKKLIKTEDINLSSLLEQAGELISRDTIYAEFEDNIVPPFQDLEKRDNIEDLLTTVMASIERSDLVNDTIITLLTDEDFQDAAVVLIQGSLQNIGTEISVTNFTALQPFLKALWDSDLLQHTLESALKDDGLKKALTSDLASLLKEGKIEESDLVSESDKTRILAKERSASSEAAASTSGSESSSSAASSASSSAAETSEDAGMISYKVNLMPFMFIVVAPFALFLI